VCKSLFGLSLPPPPPRLLGVLLLAGSLVMRCKHVIMDFKSIRALD